MTEQPKYEDLAQMLNDVIELKVTGTGQLIPVDDNAIYTVWTWTPGKSDLTKSTVIIQDNT